MSIVAGIDVSKETLDISLNGNSKSFKNSSSGYKSLAEYLKKGKVDLSSQSYHYCDAHDIHCYIPAQEKDILFWTAVGDGQIVCPMGQEPTNISYRTDKGVPRVQYSISRTKCKKCPLFDECCPRHNKHLTCFDTLAPVSRVLAAHRARSPEGKQALKRRMATIEPFFAQLKWNRNLSRLTLRGRKGAKLQVQLFALVTNLRILAKGVLDLLLRQICRMFCQRFGAKGTYPRALHLCSTGLKQRR